MDKFQELKQVILDWTAQAEAEKEALKFKSDYLYGKIVQAKLKVLYELLKVADEIEKQS